MVNIQTLEQISEEEVIANFLKAEIDSKRFGKRIHNILKEDKKSKNIIISPDLNNKQENRYRKELLGKIRGFGRNKDFFENFPKDIKWCKAIIEREKLKKVKYIDYSYWNELSNGTRLPIKAVKNIKSGVEVFGVSNKGFIEILSKIKKGITFLPMIFVAKNKRSQLVVLEGHARLTAYFLEPKYIPKTIKVIIGYSNKINNWDFY